jgi:hypothetical protein
MQSAFEGFYWRGLRLNVKPLGGRSLSQGLITDMSRKKTKGYSLLVNVESGADVRRFCQVRVDKNDNVYVFQPRKGGSVKVSYHESGQKHLKIGNGQALFIMHLERPEWIRAEEPVWSQSFENFSQLLRYDGEWADEIFEFALPSSEDGVSFLQVSIGRFFDPEGWTMDDVELRTVQERVFEVPSSASQLRLCVRILNLRAAQPAAGADR